MCLYSIAWSKQAFFAFSVALLLLAHNSLALLFVVFLGLFLLHEKKFKEFVAPMMLGFGMAAFFWAPALLERSFTRFNTVQIADSRAYFLTGPLFYLVGSAILLIGLSLLSWVKHKSTLFFLWIACIAIFLASPWSHAFWSLSFLNSFFQFPFRFLSLLAIAIPFLSASIFEFRPKKFALVILGVFLVVWTVDVTRTRSMFRPSDKPEGHFVTNEATTTVQDEYMPRWVTLREKDRSAQRIEFYEGQGEISPEVFAQHAFRVRVVASEDSVLQINTVYYPGWNIALDGRRVEVDYSNLYGLMRVPVKAGSYNLDVAFRETPLRFIIDIVSLVSIGVWLLYGWSKKSFTVSRPTQKLRVLRRKKRS
jgi:hypothetical protein